ncbi:MAG TPA: HD-GYP domain-containing protein [bacterium]|nr:HD-GYP domain-containing protein [bacterium]
MSEIEKGKLESILTGMLAVAKSMALYPAEHPSVQRPLQKTYDEIAELLRRFGLLTLGIVDEVLVFEGVPFYSLQVAIQELQARFEGVGVSALELRDGLSLEELGAFLGLLNEDAGKVREAGSLSALFREREIEHITAKDAREVYNNAVNAVGDVLQEARLGRIPRASKAKGAVADLKKMVLTDRPAILALTLIKSYDNYLFNHSVNVSVLALALARELGLTEAELSDVGLAGLLHDVGKTMTPKTITLKPGTLNPEEWEVMRRHPLKSEEIVLQMDGISEHVARMVREHHVSYDLSGYPELEPGQRPHPHSKIITVSDVYDAITTLRPYQKPYDPREAMRIMGGLAGKVIDPMYFELFVKVLGIYPIGTLVRLDTNEVAVVVETYGEAPLTPRIKVVFDPEGAPLSKPVEADLSQPESYQGEPRFIVSTVDPILFNVDPGAYL